MLLSKRNGISSCQGNNLGPLSFREITGPQPNHKRQLLKQPQTNLFFFIAIQVTLECLAPTPASTPTTSERQEELRAMTLRSYSLAAEPVQNLSQPNTGPSLLPMPSTEDHCFHSLGKYSLTPGVNTSHCVMLWEYSLYEKHTWFLGSQNLQSCGEKSC